MFKKYLGIICSLFVGLVQSMEFNTVELKKSDKKSSKKNNEVIKNEIMKDNDFLSTYIQSVYSNELVKSQLNDFFEEGSGFNGGDCDGFKKVTQIIGSDCKLCLHEMLNVYNKSEVFLSCRSAKTKETIVHHLFKNVKDDTYVQFFKDTYRILHLHNVLARAVNKDGKLPEVPKDALDPLEVEAFNNLLLKYEEKDIIPSSLLGYYLKKKMFKEAHEIIDAYDPKRSDFLTNVDTVAERTYAHFIVYLMRRETFDKYLDILIAVLKFYPDLVEKKDVDGGFPLDCLDEDTLHDERLTEDQIEILKKVLSKKFDLNLCLRRTLKKFKIF